MLSRTLRWGHYSSDFFSNLGEGVLFQVAGVVLLVAMIGAIVMTLHHKPGVKRQSVAAQVARRRSTAIEVVKVKSGQGLL